MAGEYSGDEALQIYRIMSHTVFFLTVHMYSIIKNHDSITIMPYPPEVLTDPRMVSVFKCDKSLQVSRKC